MIKSTEKRKNTRELYRHIHHYILKQLANVYQTTHSIISKWINKDSVQSKKEKENQAHKRRKKISH